jgi:hypothetical protein
MAGGDYRGQSANGGRGIDFFLAGCNAPSLVICIDDFSNLEWIRDSRAALCGAIASVLREVKV